MTLSYRVADPGSVGMCEAAVVRGQPSARSQSKSGCACCVQLAWATALACICDCGLDVGTLFFAAFAKAIPTC